MGKCKESALKAVVKFRYLLKSRQAACQIILLATMSEGKTRFCSLNPLSCKCNVASIFKVVIMLRGINFINLKILSCLLFYQLLVLVLLVLLLSILTVSTFNINKMTFDT